LHSLEELELHSMVLFYLFLIPSNTICSTACSMLPTCSNYTLIVLLTFSLVLLVGVFCSSITNLARNELLMKIVQSSFIHRFIHFCTQSIPCIENMFDTQINVLTNEIWTYDWTNVTRILHLLIKPCVKCVCNAQY
jgi:hypothetical protein